MNKPCNFFSRPINGQANGFPPVITGPNPEKIPGVSWLKEMPGMDIERKNGESPGQLSCFILRKAGGNSKEEKGKRNKKGQAMGSYHR